MVRTKEVARMSTGGGFPRKDLRQRNTEDQAVRKSTPPSWATPATISRGVNKPKPKSKPKQKPKPKPKQKPKPQCYRPRTVTLRGRGSIVNEAVHNCQMRRESNDDDQGSCALGTGFASPGSGTPQSYLSTSQLASHSQESHVMEPGSENLSLLTLAAEHMQLQGGRAAGFSVQAIVEDATGSSSDKVVEDSHLQCDEGENTTEYVGDDEMHDAAHEEKKETHEIPVKIFHASTHVNSEGRAATHHGFERSSHATSSLDLTGTADLIDDNDTFEVDSKACDDRVSVNGYRVKPQNAEVLRAIFSRYGDIGANCALESVAARSFFMELVCETIQELMTIDLTKITKNKILSLKACLGDVEKEQIEVWWLKARLDDILEAKEAIPLLKLSSNLRQQRVERETKIQTLREQLAVYGKDISIKQKEVRTLQQKLGIGLLDLSKEEAAARKIDLTISKCEAKVGHIAKLRKLGSGLV